MGAREDDLPVTASVPTYGRIIFGIGRDASYAAAHRGDFPVLKVGGLMRVPLRVALKQVLGEGADITPLLARFRDAGNRKCAA